MKTPTVILKTIRQGGNRGIALVYIALLLVALLAFVGLAIDIGYVYVATTQLQNAADAAALSGASLLDGSSSTSQAAARQEAQKFAALNKAAGQNIAIDLNTGNDNEGDVVIGYWNGSDVIPPTTGQPANAVKVTCRRTAENGSGIAATTKVPLTFSRVINWKEMGTRASAIAWRPIRPTAPISMCINACSLSTPIDFYFKQDKKYDKDPPPGETVPDEQTVGWTEFSFTSQAENLGPKSLTAQYIRGEALPPNVCNKFIYTNNGVGEVIKELRSEFDRQLKITGLPYWEVVVPILNAVENHPELTACPPGDQPLPYQVSQYAIIRITTVIKNPIPGITVSSINCIPCDENIALGKKVYLVK